MDKKDYENKQEQNILVQQVAFDTNQTASNFSKKIEKNVEGKEIYIKVISDNHNEIDAMIASLEKTKNIPNMYYIFLGDQGKTSIPGSKTSAHEAKSVQTEVDSIIYAIKKSGIDVSKILAFTSGNHEDREFDATSLELNKYVAAVLGIEADYVRNSAAIKLNFVDFADKVKHYSTSIDISHGEGKSGNPGKEVDQRISSNYAKGARVVINGDSHKIVAGTTKTQMLNPNEKGLNLVTNSYFNFGTDLPTEDYLLEKGIPPRAVRDGEVLRLTVNPTEDLNSLDVHADLINDRQLTDELVESQLNKFALELKKIKKTTFESKADLTKAYKTLINEQQLAKPHTKSYKYPNVLRLVQFSGLLVGDKNIKNEEAIKKAVEKIAKMDSSVKVIVNGDFVNYKKADFWKKQKYPEDSFAALKEFANLLEPIKERVISINSGVQETSIMKWQANELAKYSMKELQLDENKAYLPYNAKQLKLEQAKYQGAKVRAYNEALLQKTLTSYLSNMTKLDKLIDWAKTGTDEAKEVCSKFIQEDGTVDVQRMTDKDIETIVVQKLRVDNKLLDISKDQRKINRLFPVDNLKLKEVNPELLQHIVCKLWNVNPKSVAMNADMNKDNYNYIKIMDANGQVKVMNIISTYVRPSTTRKTAETKLQSKHIGADILVVNGPEFVSRERMAITNTYGEKEVVDVIHISGGRVDSENAVNRVYEIRAEKSARKRIKSGIFEDSDNMITTVSSVDYDTLKINQDDNIKLDLMKQSMKKMLKDAYSKHIEEFEKAKSKEQNKKAEESLAKQIENLE